MHITLICLLISVIFSQPLSNIVLDAAPRLSAKSLACTTRYTATYQLRGNNSNNHDNFYFVPPQQPHDYSYGILNFLNSYLINPYDINKCEPFLNIRSESDLVESDSVESDSRRNRQPREYVRGYIIPPVKYDTLQGCNFNIKGNFALINSKWNKELLDIESHCISNERQRVFRTYLADSYDRIYNCCHEKKRSTREKVGFMIILSIPLLMLIALFGFTIGKYLRRNRNIPEEIPYTLYSIEKNTDTYTDSELSPIYTPLGRDESTCIDIQTLELSPIYIKQ